MCIRDRVQGIKSQEEIGENVSMFLYGGGIQKMMQAELKKYNVSWLPSDSLNQEGYSIAKQDGVKNGEEKWIILDTREIEEKLNHTLDSIVDIDGWTFLNAYMKYEEDNVVWHRKGKGEMGEGFHLPAFPVVTNIDYLNKKNKIPYSHQELQALKAQLEKIYNKYFSTMKDEAKASRLELKPADYKFWLIQNIVKAVNNIKSEIKSTILKPMIKKAIDEFYSRQKDAEWNKSSSTYNTKTGKVQNKALWNQKYKRFSR